LTFAGESQVELVVLLVILGAIVYLFLFFQNRKLHQIQSSDVVMVEGAEARYLDLPLGSFGVPHRFKSPDRVQVIFPKLTASGDVEYIYSWHSLNAVRPVALNRSHRQNRMRFLSELAPIVKEHLKLETDKSALEAQYARLTKLANLVATSDIYAQQLPTYDKALEQTEKLFKKVEELERTYIRMVREALIGLQIAEYSPDALFNLQLPLDEQHLRIREEYQLMKDTAQAYIDLLKESRSWRNN
jgi:hypothetical protein